MAVAGYYRFRFHARAGRRRQRHLAAGAHRSRRCRAGDLLHTAISGNAEPLASGPLLKAFVRFPLLTLGVVLRIHWQALKLWRQARPLLHQT
jgi:DUF1365 family protein